MCVQGFCRMRMHECILCCIKHPSYVYMSYITIILCIIIKHLSYLYDFILCIKHPSYVYMSYITIIIYIITKHLFYLYDCILCIKHPSYVYMSYITIIICIITKHLSYLYDCILCIRTPVPWWTLLQWGMQLLCAAMQHTVLDLAIIICGTKYLAHRISSTEDVNGQL